MSDKENNRDIFIKQLEEFHIEETSSGKLLSDEEILRWERMAKVRRAEKARKTKAFLSAAAVLLLAIIIGTAIAIGPPDVHAGGEGGSEIVDGDGDGMVVKSYESIKELPTQVEDHLLIADPKSYGLVINEITYTEVIDIKQVDVLYANDQLGEVWISQIICSEDLTLKNVVFKTGSKEIWDGKKIYRKDDPNLKNMETIAFEYKETYAFIYCDKSVSEKVLKLIEEAI